MKLLLFVGLLVPILNVNSNNLKKSVEFKLYTLLDFIDNKYDQFHFDGLLGVTFADAFLRKALLFPVEENTKVKLIALINKCGTIREKIFPLLPNDPEYMITFRNELLDANKWAKVLTNEFTLGEIVHLGYYKNWTSETIIKNKKAFYKGVKSDVCLREILELSRPNEHCYISKICQEMMLDDKRIDTGYLLTHRLLYLQVIKLQNCKLPNNYWATSDYTRRYCSYIYKEVITSTLLGYPHHDILLEQVVLCGIGGYAEFLKEKWLTDLINWENPHGCYESIGQSMTKRTSFTIDFGCSDHTTGLAAAALALHLRFMLWPNVHYIV